MIKELVRAFGLGFIIAGAVFVFVNPERNQASGEEERNHDELKAQIDALESELAQTKEQLAKSQISSSMDSKEDNESESNTNENNDTNQIVKTILVIESGANSSTVSSTLQKSGVLSDLAAFEKYMSDNDLSGKIQIGEYELDSSMDYVTIAKIITRTK